MSLSRAPFGLTEQRVDVSPTIQDTQDVATVFAQRISDHDPTLVGHGSQADAQIVANPSGPRPLRQALTAFADSPDEGDRTVRAVLGYMIVERSEIRDG